MPIQFACHGCGAQFAVGDEAAGTTARCNRCGTVVSIPYPSSVLPNIPSASYASAPTYLGQPPRPATGMSIELLLGIGVGVIALVLICVLVIAFSSGWNSTPAVANAPATEAVTSTPPAPPPAQPALNSDAAAPHLPPGVTSPAATAASPESSGAPASSFSPPVTTDLPAVDNSAVTPPGATATLPAAETSPPPGVEPPGGNGENPIIPNRARTSFKTSNNSSGGGNSILPRGSSEAPQPPQRAGDNAPEEPAFPWTAKVDPPANSLDYKKGKLAIPYAGFGNVVLPHGPSNFVMIYVNQLTSEARGVFDLRTGKQVGKMIAEPVTFWGKPLLSPDGRYFAGQTLGNQGVVEVWSFITGERACTLDIPSKFGSIEMEFGAAHELVTLHKHDFENVLGTVWDLKTTEKKLEFSLPSKGFDQVDMNSLQISPGGKYAVALMGRQLGVIDLATGNGVGRLELPGTGTFMQFKAAAFSPDGAELAVLYSRDMRDALVNIDFNTGKILLAKQFNGGLDHFFYDGPVLDWLPDKSGWLYQGHLVLDHQTGGEAWTFPSTDGQPRKVIRPNEMMVVFQTKQGKAFQTTPIPQAEIAKVLEFLRSGGHAIDAALPTVSTTDLFSATPVTLPNGFVQWSYSPIGGGTASPPRGIDRELLIGRDNEDLQRVIFAGKSSAKVVVQKEVRPKYNAGGGRHDRGQTVVERYDLVTGAKGATVEIPSFYGLVDSSPSGAFAVVGYSDSKSQADRIDVIGLNQRKHVAGFRPYFSEKENAEKKLFSANRNQVKWVGFLDDETLLTISTGGKLICWKVPECKGLYFFEDFGDPVAASPNRKFLAGVHHGEFRIFEALTGKCVGDLETPSSGVKTVRAAFRDDGRELAAIMDSGQDRILVRWNLTTGKIDQEFPIPPDAVPSHVFSFHGARVGIEYRGDDFLMLDDRYLIDLKKRCIVWSYQLPWGTFVNGSADHKTWYCIRKTKDSFSGPVFLTTHETPSAEALRRSTNVKLENSLILYPGKKVKLYVDLTGVGMGHMNSTAEKSIKECLIQRGFIVDPTAPLTFSVMAGQTSTGSLIGVHAGGGSRFGHSPFGREPQTTQEIIAQQALVCRLAVSDASEVLWSKDVTVAMRTSGNINSSNVSAELTKEMYDSFQLALENGTVGTIGVPTYLFRPLDRILGGESALVFGGERLLK